MNTLRDISLHLSSGGKLRVVLDTDTFNEIDDQFALAYLLRSSDKAETEAIYAAPFKNDRADSAGEGMEKSFEEIERLLNRLERNEVPHYRGAKQFLSDSITPVGSEAVDDMIRRAMTATESERLNIIAIGAITNVASALLLKPEIVDRCNVIWLGGHHPEYPFDFEFNLSGDVAAVRTVYDSGVPLYVVPCEGVASHLRVSREELSAFLDLSDPLSSFLYKRFSEYGSEGVWTKEIWDISAVAWVVLPESVKSYSIPTPRVAEDGSYIVDQRRPPCRFAYKLDRDAIYRDLFTRLNGDF
ncbi:MAG: nucleoside hydrolase [Spirochaetaceae bacterium]|nr:nucleoside hydrolase [Spirochaetaceae bacterium]